MKSMLAIASGICMFAATLAWADVDKGLRFEAAGGAPVSLDQWRGQKLLVLFWRPDCSPCLTEARILPTIARQFADLPIALVSLQDVQDTRAHLPVMPRNVHVLIARDDGQKVLAAFGNDRTLALPYSVMLNMQGTVCDRHYGIISPQKISSWRRQC